MTYRELGDHGILELEQAENGKQHPKESRYVVYIVRICTS